MLTLFQPAMSASVNQTDRIQGMASYMNNEGALIAWFPLAMIVSGMLFVVLFLKLIAERKARKHKEEVEALKARRAEQKRRENERKAKPRY